MPAVTSFLKDYFLQREDLLFQRSAGTESRAAGAEFNVYEIQALNQKRKISGCVGLRCGAVFVCSVSFWKYYCGSEVFFHGLDMDG